MNDSDPETYKAAIEFIIKAKASYRKDASEMTWEEKVEAVERMRDAAAKARQAMAETLAQKQPPT